VNQRRRRDSTGIRRNAVAHLIRLISISMPD
jgi:hypothetical protein